MSFATFAVLYITDFPDTDTVGIPEITLSLFEETVTPVIFASTKPAGSLNAEMSRVLPVIALSAGTVTDAEALSLYFALSMSAVVVV